MVYFLPTTINTAWVSVAAGVGLLILPEHYGWDERTVEGLAVVLIVLVTALGESSPDPNSHDRAESTHSSDQTPSSLT